MTAPAATEAHNPWASFLFNFFGSKKVKSLVTISSGMDVILLPRSGPGIRSLYVAYVNSPATLSLVSLHGVQSLLGSALSRPSGGSHQPNRNPVLPPEARLFPDHGLPFDSRQMGN